MREVRGEGCGVRGERVRRDEGREGQGAEGRQGQARKTGAEVATVQGSRAGLRRAAEATVT